MTSVSHKVWLSWQVENYSYWAIMFSFWEFFFHNENQKFIEQKEFSLRNKFLQSDSPFFYLFELIFEWNRLYISIHDPFEVMKICTLYLIRPFCKSLYKTSNAKGSIFSYTLKKLKKQWSKYCFLDTFNPILQLCLDLLIA